MVTVNDDDEGTDLALEAVHEMYPTLVWESAERTEEGWDHDVLILRGCSGADARGRADLVFRFPTDSHAYERLPHEVEVLDHLATRVDVAVPRYTHRPASLDGGGLRFAGYPMIRGDRLTPELLAALPATERTSLASQIGGLLSALHVLDTSSSPIDRVPAAYQPENLDFARQVLATDLPEVFTEDELCTAREICHEVAALLADRAGPGRPMVFLHNDLDPRHLYWQRETAAAPGRLGVIDFTDMCLGDPAADFAGLYDYGPAFVGEVLAHYVGRIHPRPGEADLLGRAWTYRRLEALFLVAAHLRYGIQTWPQARAMFDHSRSPHRPRA